MKYIQFDHGILAQAFLSIHLTLSHLKGLLRPKNKNSKQVIVGGWACILVIWMNFLWSSLKREGKKVNNKKKDVTMIHYEFENENSTEEVFIRNFVCCNKELCRIRERLNKGFNLDSYVAVTRISKGSKQGIIEYAWEVKIISQLRHRNLVKLIGWCHQEKKLLLVYEFMPDGSFDFHLFKDDMDIEVNIARG